MYFGTIQVKKQRYTNTVCFVLFFSSHEIIAARRAQSMSHTKTQGWIMHSTRKGEQISQKFLQLLSQTLCYWSIFSFSGLPLKGSTPKLPFLNARTLGGLRLSYNLKLVSQYRQGKHPLDWLLSSIPVTFRTMGAGDVCVSISSQQSFLCCTESLSPLTKPFLLSSVFGEHSMVHKFSFQISPEAGESLPGLYFCLQCGKQNFPCDAAPAPH